MQRKNPNSRFIKNNHLSSRAIMNPKNINILAIESSCDETAAAVYSTNHGLESSLIFSQLELHQEFGGVIPEAASRSHLEKINNIVEQALQESTKKLDDIDVIAVTNKPGLPGSLLVGLCFAKALAWAKNKKIIGVNHLEGHIFSTFIEYNVPFPHICLTASGGHTAMYLVENYGEYKLIGQTSDDAAGEAFDKAAKLLGLNYPGGPIIEKLAQANEFKDICIFPRGSNKNLDFSFSGLKTAVLYYLVNLGYLTAQDKYPSKTVESQVQKDIASSLLVCIGDIFEKKLTQAYKLYPKIKAITFVGGVACNKYLKNRLEKWANSRHLVYFTPSHQYCADNAAMIAVVGHYKAQQKKIDTFELDIY
jgi:N6-L-threonylcarbamoyladenine synthase